MYDVRCMKDYPYKMTVEQARAFGEDVLNIVSQIPYGRVTTYGHIAALAGWPSHSRMVGRTLRYSPGAEKLPCHRVVNKEGRTAPGWSGQRALLEKEGVSFKPNGHVDMQHHLWEPEVGGEVMERPPQSPCLGGRNVEASLGLPEGRRLMDDV